jgi:hypothetical protein
MVIGFAWGARRPSSLALRGARTFQVRYCQNLCPLKRPSSRAAGISGLFQETPIFSTGHQWDKPDHDGAAEMKIPIGIIFVPFGTVLRPFFA